MTLGEKIRIASKRKRLSQERLAKKLNLDVRKVQEWELDWEAPDEEQLQRLSQILGVSYSWLSSADEEQVPDNVNNTDAYEGNHSRARKISGIVLIIIAALMLIAECFYHVVAKPNGYEFIWSSFKYGLPFGALLFGVCGICCIKDLGQRTGRTLLISAFLCFAIGALVLPWVFEGNIKETVRFSKNYKNIVVIKADKKTGRVCFYRRRGVIFAKQKEQFPYTLQGDMKLQWFTDDICGITYEATDGNIHQFIATYGDRGDGISYDNVASAITGNWTMEDSNTAGWGVTVNRDGITIKNATASETYSYSDCVQFGTIALALCKEGLPKWDILLSENCSIGDDCLIENGGTIILCQVSMDKTAPMELMCTTPKYTPVQNGGEIGQNDSSTPTIDSMKALLESGESLKGQSLSQGIALVESKSDNLYWISRLALQQIAESYAINGVDVNVQLNECSVLGQGDNDWLVDVNATEVCISPGNQGSQPTEETAAMEYKLRIMKKGDLYLIGKMAYGEDCMHGLSEVTGDTEDFSNNKAYHFFVQGEYDTTYMYVGRKSPEEACDMLLRTLKDKYPKAEKMDGVIGYALDKADNILLIYDGISEDCQSYCFYIASFEGNSIKESNGNITFIAEYAVRLSDGAIEQKQLARD